MSGRALGLRALPIASDGVLLGALFGASAFIAKSQLTALAPELVGSAVLIDLVLTSALCHWIICVRLGGFPPWTTVTVAAGGLAISRIILPSGVGDAGILPLAALVAVEGATLLLMATRVATIRGAYSVWAQTVTGDANETRVNLAFNRKSPLVDVVSCLPYRGELDLTVNDAKKVLVRIPEWAPRDGVQVFRAKEKVPGVPQLPR